MIVFYFGSHREYIILLYGEYKVDFNLKARGTCSKHYA
jgi:hypothetical protein